MRHINPAAGVARLQGHSTERIKSQSMGRDSSALQNDSLRPPELGRPALALEAPLQRREIFTLAGLLVLAATVRLIDISQPFVDRWSFKQGTIAMIAENFYRNGFNIFYPQINWAGSSPGYIGTEFPLVPFIASLLYGPLGVHEWIGRSISVVFFVLGLPFFYLLVRKTSNERSAAFAAFIYAFVPLSIFASRSFMSDMTSLSFSIVALYCFSRWLQRSDSLPLLFAAGLAAALAILVKAPAVIIGLPLLYMAWEEYGPRCLMRPMLWLFAILSLLLPMAWYLHAYLVTLSYPPYKFAGSEGLALVDFKFYVSIVREVLISGLTPITAAGMLLGFFLPAPGKYNRLFHWWFAAICLFVFTAGYGNRHPWYQLPLVPVAAALAGRALDFGLGRFAAFNRSRSAEFFVAASILGALAFVSYIYVTPLYEPWAVPLWNAGHEIDRIAPLDAQIIFVADGDSSEIYYSKRKGWHAFDESDWGPPLNSQEAILGLEKLRTRGATHLVFTQYTVWWLDYYKGFGHYLDSHYRRIAETQDYVIFDLAAKLNDKITTSSPPAATPMPAPAA